MQIIPQSGPHKHLTSHVPNLKSNSQYADHSTVWPTQTPDFTSSKSQVQFPVCRSIHRICPSL